MSNEVPSRLPLRVLHVLNELRASGAEVMLRSAADQWREHGVESHILAVAPAVGPLAQDLRAVGYRVARLPDSPLRRVPFRLGRHVRAGGYDVVHLHAERGNFWFALAALSAGAAVVRTVHSVFQFHGPLRAERSVQRRMLSALGTVHVAVSASVTENELRYFGNTSQVVENWYDSAFSPPSPQERARARADLGLDERHLVAVSVGNCSSVKRHGMVLEAMAHPMSPADLMYLHVGQEDEAHSERCLADQLGVVKRTCFLGLDHPLKALHAADVFVMPSSHEGVGIAAIEALATGLPAVLADVPGLRDLATAGPAVMLTEATPEAFARALAVAGRDERIRGAPHALRDRFGMARGVAAYAAIYHGLRDGRRR
ncbi:glycosyltransferase [Streptomyces collinus]|uniref:glycosyltransferase n=1 Tax=Streptomyces collinus TaxID=42684 RepID=UPI0037D51703